MEGREKVSVPTHADVQSTVHMVMFWQEPVLAAYHIQRKFEEKNHLGINITLKFILRGEQQSVCQVSKQVVLFWGLCIYTLHNLQYCQVMPFNSGMCSHD